LAQHVEKGAPAPAAVVAVELDALQEHEHPQYVRIPGSGDPPFPGFALAIFVQGPLH
jgi:hypothetical protein